MIALLADKASVFIEHPSDAAGHARSEVLSRPAQHQHSAPRHVFATVISHAFDDSGCARIADREALASAPGRKQAACGSAVQRDIAEQDMVGAFARGIALGAKHDLSAAEALADEVIGQTFEDEPHARDGKSTKRLAGNTLQFDLDGRHRFAMVQAFLPSVTEGDKRVLLLDGEPLGAILRVPRGDDIRSNIHAGGKAEAVEIGETELKVAEIIRPKLLSDGMFLIGIDIVGDKILEVNVFSPGNLHSCSDLAGVDFSVPILEAIERKVAIKAQYAHAFDNRHLAIL